MDVDPWLKNLDPETQKTERSNLKIALGALTDGIVVRARTNKDELLKELEKYLLSRDYEASTRKTVKYSFLRWLRYEGTENATVEDKRKYLEAVKPRGDWQRTFIKGELERLKQFGPYYAVTQKQKAKLEELSGRPFKCSVRKRTKP